MKETDTTIRNLRVSDMSWYEFKRQLDYKADWYEKTVSKVIYITNMFLLWL